MAANNLPVYPLTPNTGAKNVVLSTGNTTKDGTAGTTLLFTAGANGSRIKFIELHATASNVASLLRVFLNNGSTVGTAANNILIGELALPITTLSETTLSGPPMILPMNRELAAGEKIYVVLATGATGWACSAWGEDF